METISRSASRSSATAATGSAGSDNDRLSAPAMKAGLSPRAPVKTTAFTVLSAAIDSTAATRASSIAADIALRESAGD